MCIYVFVYDHEYFSDTVFIYTNRVWIFLGARIPSARVEGWLPGSLTRKAAKQPPSCNRFQPPKPSLHV